MADILEKETQLSIFCTGRKVENRVSQFVCFQPFNYHSFVVVHAIPVQVIDEIRTEITRQCRVLRSRLNGKSTINSDTPQSILQVQKKKEKKLIRMQTHMHRVIRFS